MTSSAHDRKILVDNCLFLTKINSHEVELRYAEGEIKAVVTVGINELAHALKKLKEA
jgi:hypothetical protein